MKAILSFSTLFVLYVSVRNNVLALSIQDALRTLDMYLIILYIVARNNYTYSSATIKLTQKLRQLLKKIYKTRVTIKITRIF